MQLSKSEEELMNILWKLNKAYMKDLLDAYKEPRPATTTIATLLKNYETYQPRKFFIDNYGPKVCGRILGSFLKGVYPDFKEEYCEPYCCR